MKQVALVMMLVMALNHDSATHDNFGKIFVQFFHPFTNIGFHRIRVFHVAKG
jgi:hypothetical protein